MANNQKTIIVTHVNIRQSISFLVLKLILIDILTALALLFFFLLPSSYISMEIKLALFSSSIFYFLGIIVLKTLLSLFTVLQWLCDYYEIWSNKVTHKKGIFWTKKEDHELVDLKYLGFEQGLFGRLLNFGTITLFDWKNEVKATLYLIHNPKKYYQLLQHLVPTLEREEKTILEHSKDKD